MKLEKNKSNIYVFWLLGYQPPTSQDNPQPANALCALRNFQEFSKFIEYCIDSVNNNQEMTTVKIPENSVKSKRKGEFNVYKVLDVYEKEDKKYKYPESGKKF